MYYTNLCDSHIEELAIIISNNYKKAKFVLPILPRKYESVQMHIKRLKEHVNDSNSIVAIDSGKVAGFISGFGINNFKGTVNGALSIPSLHGVAEGYDKNYIYTELYRHISKVWASSGCYTHGVMLYVNDKETIDTWVLNGFGMLVIDAVRSLDKIKLSETESQIKVRVAKVSDIPELIPLLKGIDEHLAASPVFLHNHISDNYLKEYSDWLNIESNILWIAELDNKIVGYLKTNTTEINIDELDDGYTMGINGAYVLPQYRGHQITSHLLNNAIDWAISKGLKRCSTDFESSNIEGRRYWLSHFTPCCYSMIRRIDERNYLAPCKEGAKNE